MTEPYNEDSCAPFPLTEMQQAYWIGRNSGLELGNVSPQRWMEVEGDFNAHTMTAAWNRLISRHDMLRAVLLRDGYQRILPEVPQYRIDVTDLRGEAPAAVAEYLAHKREALTRTKIDPYVWPLFEVTATRLLDARYRLSIVFDMLAVDLRSFQILFRDLAAIYDGREAELPPINRGFRDYVLTHQKNKETVAYERARAYWRVLLPTLPAAPELPLRNPLANLHAPFLTQRAATVGPDVWAGVKRHAAQCGVTPTTVVLTVFAEALRTWSRRSPFSLVMTVFSRAELHEPVADVIGDFTSTIILEANFERSESFADRVCRMQNQVWARLRRSQFNGVEVLREWNQMSGTPGRASTPIAFNSMLLPAEANLPSPSAMEGPIGSVDDLIAESTDGRGRLAAERHLGPLGEMVYSAGQVPQVLLEVRIFERAGRLVMLVESVDEALPLGLPLQIGQAMESALIHLAASERAWQSSLPSMVPESHLAHRRGISESAKRDLPVASLHEAALAPARRYPHTVAAVGPAWTLTYTELDQKSSRLAARLTDLGVGPGDRVALFLSHGWEVIVAQCGVLRAGAAYVPISIDTPPSRLLILLGQADVSVVLAESALKEPQRDGSPPCITVAEAIAEPGEPLEPPTIGSVRVEQNSLAYIIYTSGSTGEPKGVMIEHGAAANTIFDINSRFDVAPSDRVLAVSRPSFDLSVYDVFGLLAAGGCVVVPDPARRRDPAHWAELSHEHAVTVWNSVPSIMASFVEYLESRPSVPRAGLRLVLLSGDWIPVSLPDRIRAIFPDAMVVSLGGATEASIWSTYYEIGTVAADWLRIPYGRPLANQQLSILDDVTHEERPPLVPGQLYIGGRGLARGYWRDPVQTTSSFITHPGTGERLYRTGDVCRYLSDGNVDILGRDDSQVKIRGYRVELSEIETAIGTHPDVTDALVVARASSSGDRQLIAYVAVTNSCTAETLETHTRRLLQDYMIPARWMTVAEIPRTSNGKVDHAGLPVLDPVDAPSAGPVPEHLRDATDQIRRIVETLLSISLPSGDVNLSELGASSLDFIRLINQFEEELGFRPVLVDVFEQPSLVALAQSYADWRASGSREEGPTLQLRPQS